MLRSDIGFSIDAVDLCRFLSMLPGGNQEKHCLATPYLDCGKTSHSWIFRNADFKQWNDAGSSRILWLSGPPECSVHRATSFILDQERDNSLKKRRLVLYFHCSTSAAKGSSIVTLVSTFVQQIVSFSSEGNQISIVQTFLRCLLNYFFEALPPKSILRHFSGNSDSHIKKLLLAPVDSLWPALWAIMPPGQNLELSVVIGGIEHVRDQRSEFIRAVRAFVEDLQRTSKVKILLTSGLEADTAEVFDGLLHIEYDKERKGLPSTLISIQTVPTLTTNRMSFQSSLR